DVGHGIGHIGDDAHRLIVRHVEDAQGFVVAAGGDVAAVRRERHAVNVVREPAETARFFARRYLPKIGVAVIATGQQRGAVAGDRHAVDVLVVRVTLDLHAALEIPEPGGG